MLQLLKKNIKTLDNRLWEVGAKRRLNGTSKVKRRTNRKTHGQTFRLIESISSEDRCFKNKNPKETFNAM